MTPILLIYRLTLPAMAKTNSAKAGRTWTTSRRTWTPMPPHSRRSRETSKTLVFFVCSYFLFILEIA